MSNDPRTRTPKDRRRHAKRRNITITDDRVQILLTINPHVSTAIAELIDAYKRKVKNQHANTNERPHDPTASLSPGN